MTDAKRPSIVTYAHRYKRPPDAAAPASPVTPLPIERAVDRTPGDAETLRDRSGTQLGPQLRVATHPHTRGGSVWCGGQMAAPPPIVHLSCIIHVWWHGEIAGRSGRWVHVSRRAITVAFADQA